MHGFWHFCLIVTNCQVFEVWHPRGPSMSDPWWIAFRPLCFTYWNVSRAKKPEWNCYCEQLPPWSQTLSSLLAFCMGINPINNSIVSQKSNQLRGPGRNNEQQCTSLELEVDQELGRGELRWGAYRGFYIIPQMPARDTAIASNWGLCAEVGLSTQLRTGTVMYICTCTQKILWDLL